MKMKITIPMERKPEVKTDLTPVEIRSPAVASMMGKLLGPERVERSDKKALQEWLTRYRKLIAVDATVGQLQALIDECPVKDLYEIGELRRLIERRNGGHKPARP